MTILTDDQTVIFKSQQVLYKMNLINDQIALDKEYSIAN